MTVIVIEQFDETLPVISSYSTHFPSGVKLGSAVLGKNFKDVIGIEISVIQPQLFSCLQGSFNLPW